MGFYGSCKFVITSNFINSPTGYKPYIDDSDHTTITPTVANFYTMNIK